MDYPCLNGFKSIFYKYNMRLNIVMHNFAYLGKRLVVVLILIFSLNNSDFLSSKWWLLIQDWYFSKVCRSWLTCPISPLFSQKSPPLEAKNMDWDQIYYKFNNGETRSSILKMEDYFCDFGKIKWLKVQFLYDRYFKHLWNQLSLVKWKRPNFHNAIDQYLNLNFKMYSYLVSDACFEYDYFSRNNLWLTKQKNNRLRKYIRFGFKSF